MYIQEVVAAVNVLTNCVYIILKFLLASIFCHCDYLCNTANCLHEIPYFMKPSPFLCDTVYKFSLDATKTTPRLMVTPPHIYLLLNVGILLSKKG